MLRAATAPRRGFTLIELMVVMSVIIILSSIALVVVPNVIDQDRTTEGAGRLQQWLAVARLRAARDQLPRGIKLIYNGDAANPAATEVQYIEVARPSEVTARILIAYDPNFPSDQPGQESPKGGFGVFVIGPQGLNTSVFVAGSDIQIPELGKSLRIQRCLTGTEFTRPTETTFPNVVYQRPDGSSVTLKHLLTKVTPSAALGAEKPGVLFGKGTPTSANDLATPNNGTGGDDVVLCKLVLATEPRDLNAGELGATTTLRYDTDPTIPHTAGGYPHLGLGTAVLLTGPFTVFPPTSPLLGEPVMQLPKNIGVDLFSSQYPNPGTGTQDLNIVFNPGGDLQAVGSPLYLWVRDITKKGGKSNPFEGGGEQQVVTVKSTTGTTRVSPISWTGDPFKFAKE